MGRAGGRASAGDATTTSMVCGRALAACALAAVVAISAVAMACRTAYAATCAGETLRSSLESSLLPDCRAYEMVTPPYKDGYPLFLRSFASDGERAILESYGGLADLSGSGEGFEGNLYLDTRSSDGWRLSSMMEPLRDLVGQEEVAGAAEANDGMSLWQAHTPRQSAKTDELYVRSESGDYTRVGTLSPVAEENATRKSAEVRATPVATTSDFQHVVIQGNQGTQDHWPFDDTTGKNSLYEYSGVNNERPVLVAATGEKPTDDAYDERLLAGCGSELGGGKEGSVYNAFSASGEVIFFTLAPCSPGQKTDEVNARMHGSVSSPEPAETVDASEPECTGVECEQESGKNFEGASESGEKLFFTSTQKLTTNASDLAADGSATQEEGQPGCSQEQNASGCNLYEYDFALEVGHRLVLVAGGADKVRGVAGIAEDGSRIYYAAEGKVPGYGENEFHRLPEEDKPNLYVYDTDTGVTSFIATLSQQDEADWARRFFRPVEVTGEGGRFMLFASYAQGVTPDTTNELDAAQLFEYDAETGELVRVTQGERAAGAHGEKGWNDDGNDVTAGIRLETIELISKSLGEEDDFKATTNRSNIAKDGKTILFETAGELSPLAGPASALGCSSVYEFRSEGSIDAGAVHLLSDGRDVPIHKGEVCGAEFIGMDENGNNILFSTTDPLLNSDVDGGQPDIYDARVNGGVSPRSVEGEARACAAMTCEGPTTPASGGVAVTPAAGAEGDFAPAGTSNPAVGSTSKGPGSSSKSSTKKEGSRKTCKNGVMRRRGTCRGLSQKRRRLKVHVKRSAGKGLR